MSLLFLPTCRFIVTQHRQAVAIQSSPRLAAYCESLIGTARFANEIAAVEIRLRQAREELDDLYDESDRCI